MRKEKKNIYLLVTIMAMAVLVFVLIPSCNQFMKERRIKKEFNSGLNLFNKGEYQEALPVLKSVYNRADGFNEQIDALYLIGRCYHEKKDEEEAKRIFNQLLSEDKRKKYRDEALFYLGKIAKKEGEYSEASRFYEELLTKSRDSELADQTLHEEALLREKKGELLQARDLFMKIIEDFPGSENILSVQEDLSRINMKILFSPTIIPGESEDYIVQSGDSLDRIAREFNTTIPLIKMSNDIAGDVIRVGESLKVVTGTFSIVVDKSQNILILKLNDRFFKLYHVGTGKNNNTPVGEYKIINKIKDPPWYTDGRVIPFGNPDNLLGTRWMGIDKKGYGIHGTWEPESVGSQSSAGCIRLLNEDVEELFMIIPLGTPVTIVD